MRYLMLAALAMLSACGPAPVPTCPVDAGIVGCNGLYQCGPGLACSTIVGGRAECMREPDALAPCAPGEVSASGFYRPEFGPSPSSPEPYVCYRPCGADGACPLAYSCGYTTSGRACVPSACTNP